MAHTPTPWNLHHAYMPIELKRDDGKVKDANGKLVCTICYNGRVKLPNGQFVDGMSGQQWMSLCAS